MKAYMGFKRATGCSGFRCEEGKTYKSNALEGFIACENPLDVFEDYPPDMLGEYHEVELGGIIETGNGKCAASKIKIGAKLGIAGIVKAFIAMAKKAVETNTDDCAKIANDSEGAQIGNTGEKARISSVGGFAEVGNAGNCAKIVSAGSFDKIANAGYGSMICSAGDCTRIANSGDWGHICSAGIQTLIGSTGNRNYISSTGACSRIGSEGNVTQIISAGYETQIESLGKDCAIACTGDGSMVKAKAGSWICLTEWDRYKPVGMKSAQIDGIRLKADIWYTLKDGKFVEVPEDADRI